MLKISKEIELARKRECVRESCSFKRGTIEHQFQAVWRGLRFFVLGLSTLACCSGVERERAKEGHAFVAHVAATSDQDRLSGLTSGGHARGTSAAHSGSIHHDQPQSPGGKTGNKILATRAQTSVASRGENLL